MKKSNNKRGKPLPYWIKNHVLDEHLDTIGEWMVCNNFVVRKSVVESISDPIRVMKRAKEMEWGEGIIKRKIDEWLILDDLTPVLDHRIINPDLETLDEIVWELTTLPPKAKSVIIPPTDTNWFDVRKGLAVWWVYYIPLGWILYRLQDIDSEIEWMISLSERRLFLHRGGEIVAIIGVYRDLGWSAREVKEKLERLEGEMREVVR